AFTLSVLSRAWSTNTLPFSPFNVILSSIIEPALYFLFSDVLAITLSSTVTRSPFSSNLNSIDFVVLSLIIVMVLTSTPTTPSTRYGGLFAGLCRQCSDLRYFLTCTGIHASDISLNICFTLLSDLVGDVGTPL